MQLQLIMLDNPIVVSDEEIVTKDYFYDNSLNNHHIRKMVYPKWGEEGQGNCKKIIAGIPELPSIDFSALSDEDCKRIGWVDVEKLFNISYKEITFRSNLQREIALIDFIKGFKTAQSLNDKKFTEEDMMYLAKNLSRELHLNTNISITEAVDITCTIIKQLSQPKVFDIEVEMEIFHDFYKGGGFGGAGSFDQERPKITNNSIKITKIL